MSEDATPPPLDNPPEEWDEKWHEKTTITVDRWVKAALDHDREGKPWNEYLNGLRRLKADPLTFSEVEAIAEHLEDELSLTIDQDELQMEFPATDVKEAVRQVIREEFEGVL